MTAFCIPVFFLWSLSLLILLSFMSFIPATTQADAWADAIVYNDYPEMLFRMRTLVEENPKILSMYSANERFQLPTVGDCAEFSTQNTTGTRQVPCQQWVIELYIPIQKLGIDQTEVQTPQMLISGELHGDERIGPMACIEFLQAVVDAFKIVQETKQGSANSLIEIVQGKRIVIIPMTNAVGYHKKSREEIHPGGNSFDVNRDFAFNQRPEACMNTIGARVVNELFRANLFSLMITFHAGTNVLSYEWGDYGHCSTNGVCSVAPDFKAMQALAQKMKQYAGPVGFPDEDGEYVVGDMGSTVYPVRGGMEDWAYGASWAGLDGYVESKSPPCSPVSSFADAKPYPSDKTVYNDATHRCITYLVETSNKKEPPQNTLGSRNNAFHKDSPGHVVRNMRLILAAVESLQPQVSIISVELTDIDTMRKGAQVKFSILGAFFVDQTYIQWSTHQEGAQEDQHSGGTSSQQGQPSTYYESVTYSDIVPVQRGHDDMYFRVVCHVDKEILGDLISTDLYKRPQSHYVNRRFNSEWVKENNGYRVSGAVQFFSSTYQLTYAGNGTIYAMIRPDLDLLWDQPGGLWGEEPGIISTNSGGSSGGGTLTGNGQKHLFVVVLVGVVCSVAILSVVGFIVSRFVRNMREKKTLTQTSFNEDMEELSAPLWGDYDDDSD